MAALGFQVVVPCKLLCADIGGVGVCCSQVWLRHREHPTEAAILSELPTSLRGRVATHITQGELHLRMAQGYCFWRCKTHTTAWAAFVHRAA
jgi:hypothetical protein